MKFAIFAASALILASSASALVGPLEKLQPGSVLQSLEGRSDCLVNDVFLVKRPAGHKVKKFCGPFKADCAPNKNTHYSCHKGKDGNIEATCTRNSVNGDRTSTSYANKFLAKHPDLYRKPDGTRFEGTEPEVLCSKTT